jgi:hypothetical protein
MIAIRGGFGSARDVSLKEARELAEGRQRKQGRWPAASATASSRKNSSVPLSSVSSSEFLFASRE